MPMHNFSLRLSKEIDEIDRLGTSKTEEPVITRIKKPEGDKGPRVFLDCHGDRECLRMNSNSYMGMSMREEVVAAEEAAARRYGVGPGAVRFISGTFEPHVELERRLAAFHGRQDALITSSAYTTVMGVIVTLTTPDTIIISDELNHNCIINAMRLARPKDKKIFKHLDLEMLEARIEESVGQCESLIVATDGVFSMRGTVAPLKEISALVAAYNDKFPGDIVLMVDDSHGVGALGAGGRGAEEYTGANGIDILVSTLGKAFGVNGGYVVSEAVVIRYLREKNPFYIFTNPITPPEAAAALKAIEILDSETGRRLLMHLHAMTKRFEEGLVKLGYETISSDHPVVPLLVRNTEKTGDLVEYLCDHGVLATGINFPVVPKGDELIRFQISADHTPGDIDYTLAVLAKYKEA